MDTPTATGAPPTAYSLRGTLAMTGGNTAAASVYAGAAGSPVAIAQIQAVNSSTDISYSTTFDVIPDVAGQLQYAAGSVSAADLYIIGFTDSIGV